MVTPQSLYLMNSPNIVELAAAFADRLLLEAKRTDERIESGVSALLRPLAKRR